jgi:hypothetical protein
VNTDAEGPCEPDQHFLEDENATYGTCTECGYFVNQYAYQDEEGP